MKNTSKTQLNSALKAIITRLEKTEKFVLTELPELCQQIIKEKVMREKMDVIIGIVVSTLSVAVCIASGIYAYNFSYMSGRDGISFILGILSVLAGVFTISNGIFCIQSYQNLLSVKIAPKLYILEKLRDLIGD